MRRSVAPLVVLGLVAAAPVHAQATLPEFRQGQWAGEIGRGAAGESVHLLRFRSPTSAWLVGLEGNLQRTTNEQTVTIPAEDTDESTSTLGGATVRVGVRRYAGAGASLRPVTGAGVAAGHSRQSFGGGDGTSTSTTAGLYGELGAVYRLGAHASLGVVGELRAQYARQRQEATGLERTSTTVGLSASAARLLATVYF